MGNCPTLLYKICCSIRYYEEFKLLVRLYYNAFYCIGSNTDILGMYNDTKNFYLFMGYII